MLRSSTADGISSVHDLLESTEGEDPADAKFKRKRRKVRAQAKMLLEYDNGTCGGNPLIFQLVGSVYPQVLLPGLISASICIIFREYNIQGGDEMSLKPAFEHHFTYQIYVYILGFFLVFRCDQAYSRYWEVRTNMELMTSKWSIAALQSVIFDNFGNLDEYTVGVKQADLLAFRHRIISLYSLLCATALGSLVHNESLEVIEGVNKKETLLHLNHEEVCDQVFLVRTWVEDSLIRRRDQGGLSIPAPICTRIFQELSTGMLAYNDCTKIVDTPFPFPYAQMITGSLLFMMLTCGVIMQVVYQTSYFFAVLFSFVSVSMYYMLNEVAILLENPIGDRATSLPVHKYMTDFNDRLRPLLKLNEGIFKAPPNDYLVLEYSADETENRNAARSFFTDLEEKRSAARRAELDKASEGLRKAFG